MKGCGKKLGDERFQFYCGKYCEWCSDDHIHYCDKCKASNHGKLPFKENYKEVKK